jgi:hypothetical protein
MRRACRLANVSVLVVASFGIPSATAGLSAHLQRGDHIMEIPLPAKKAEVCVIPKHLPGGNYSSDDLASEKHLCSLDERKNAAVCPKLNSTNPGLEFYSVPQGTAPSQIVAANCKTPGGKKVAKYKLSTSCSYTPSILGYYHMSRILGGIGDVPPAVIRTYDREDHIALGRRALAQTPSASLIHQTWASLMAQLTAGANASRRDLLLTDDFTQSYGALSVDPSNESFYSEFFNGGSNNLAKATNFRDKNSTVRLLARDAEISSLVSRSFSSANVQTMVQLRDAADMIVIDTLMNQQDRFGNIHYLEIYYYQDPNDLNANGEKKVKSSYDLSPDKATALGAVRVKKMLLKDNDCGVTKQNLAKQADLADRLSHIRPETYENLLKLDRVADAAATKEFLIEEALFTQTDWASVRKTLHDLASKLHQACTQGKLRLDLDLDAHFSGRPDKQHACDS